MAGLGMRDIKRRIKSVNSTKQITKAMELVASSKMKKARERLETTRPYFHAVRDAVSDIVSNSKGVSNTFITPRETIKNTGYIVISADRGLAGGYNANVIKAAMQHMSQKEQVSVITIGQKARDFFKKRKYNLSGEFHHISENPQYSDAQSIGRLSLDLYKQGLVDEVYLVYTEFLSTISYNPKVIKLLPLEPEKIENQEKSGSRELMSYEPYPEVVLSYLIPKYIDSSIYGALIESSASYQSATKVAMENATDNAEEMIDKLQLQYNRARQASITQEITEIVGGAEALS